MDQPMRKRPIAFGLSLICTIAIYGSASGGYIINAASGSSVDIQAAVNQAVTGDTIAIPAGRFLFTGQVFAPGSVPGEPTGVIYHNEFIDNWYTYLGYGIAVNGSPSTWKGSVTLGSANALFIEDNFFDLNRHCVTASNGAIYVARYNTVIDNYQDAAAFDAHGLTPSWPRGTRSVEIYNYTVTNSITRWAGADIRGGGGVIWGNK